MQYGLICGLKAAPLLLRQANVQRLLDQTLLHARPRGTRGRRRRVRPSAHDMPYTPYTDSTLGRLAALAPQTLAIMHGSSFRGDGRAAIAELAGVIGEVLGKTAGGS